MSFFEGFFYAGRGIVNAFSERNFRFHLCAMAAVIYFGVKFYTFDKTQWAVLLLTCAAVLSLEAVNTALERLCDKVSSEKDELIRKSKDISAGAVLISAIIAAVIGVLFFWDIEKFADIAGYFSEPLKLILLIICVIAAVLFVVLPKRSKKK